MVDRRSRVAKLTGIGLFVLAAALFVAAIATKSTLGTLAMTAAQLGVLAFYWFPWSFAWDSREPVAATIFGVLFLVVSLAIIGWSGTILIQDIPFLGWGPFLIVHLGANVALALRPRVYLWWLLGVWTIGPLVLASLLLLQSAFSGGFPPVEVLLTTLLRNTDNLRELPGLIFWLFSLGSFTGTAAGLGFALIWRNTKMKARTVVPSEATSPSR